MIHSMMNFSSSTQPLTADLPEAMILLLLQLEDAQRDEDIYTELVWEPLATL